VNADLAKQLSDFRKIAGALVAVRRLQDSYDDYSRLPGVDDAEKMLRLVANLLGRHLRRDLGRIYGNPGWKH
jgi:hypothetical protein